MQKRKLDKNRPGKSVPADGVIGMMVSRGPSVYGLAPMRQQPPIFYSDPAEVVTLEIEVPPDDVAVATRRVLLLEDRDDFREVLRDHLASRVFR